MAETSGTHSMDATLLDFQRGSGWRRGMGIGIRIYLVNDDDTLRRFPLARFQRLLDGDPDERLADYAGKRLRYVLAAVEMLNRKPLTPVWLEFNYLALDSQGRLDEEELQERRGMGIDMLSTIDTRERDSKVVDARDRFARRRYEARYTWQPTAEIEKAVFKAIFVTGRR